MELLINGESAKTLLKFLQRIEGGYIPTEDEVRNMNKIHVVDFSNFKLTSLPDSIEKLTQLIELDVSYNRLTSLPESIGKFSKCTKLNISHNRLTGLPESIGKLSKCIRLNVSHNQLTSLPESIGKLSKCTKLNASHNQLASLPENIGKLSKCTKLNISYNWLTSLPESVGNLPQLAVLDISYNWLTGLPENIGRLLQCTELNVSHNRLTSLPEGIGKLLKCAKLNVSHNQLINLPEAIGKLSECTKLTISHNQLISLPESIGELSKCTELNVSHNQLTGLPESIKNLSNLLNLDLIKNQLRELPEWLHGIKSLTNLQLSGNPIITLPFWLGDMQQLTSLGLWGLGLQEVPCWIRQLSKLRELMLGDNPLKVLPDWLGNMSLLNKLMLDNLRLTEFPQSLLELQLPFFADLNTWANNDFYGIYIADTVLSIQPVSMFDQSRDKSINYCESRKLIKDYFDAPKIPIREAKVIFLGDGKVGKTYTIQRLLHDCRKDDYPTKETHGILIENLYTKKDGQTYKVCIWDFGGQDIMHEMHRCFLTDRTCYVVMVDTRTDKQTGRARYWLRTVQSVAPKAPVLLLVNEISGGQNRDLDYSTLKQEFSNLMGVQYCSSLNASDEEFRQKVAKTIFEQSLSLDSCKMDLPESWELVRQNLLKQKDSAAYYIDRNTFHGLCDQYGVPSDNGLRAWLLTWFNDLGVCFSYHLGEDGQAYTDYKILDPMWLTSAVYKIIWEKARTDDGLISLSEIHRILETPGSDAMKKDGIPCLEDVSYNMTECGYVLDIMRMFRISYPADKYTEFMPTLCKPDAKLDPTPQTWRQHAAYRFVYSFLPESVLHRLMIYCFANLRPGKRWRKGFWLECESQGLSAVIRTTGRDSEENELQIDVYAQNEQYETWMWMQLLCRQIMSINDMLSLKSKEYILAENDEEKKWFCLDSVWGWRKQGEQNLQGEKSYFKIQSLLMLIYGRYYPDVEGKLMDKRDKYQLPISSKVLPQTITSEIVEMTGLDLSKPLHNQFLKEWKRSNDLKEREIAAMERHTVVTEVNTKAQQENTFALQQSNDILQAVRDGKAILPQEVMAALAEAFRQSEKPALKTAGQKMKWCFWMDKGKLLRELLGDAANLATVMQILVKIGNTYGPILLEQLKILAQT